MSKKESASCLDIWMVLANNLPEVKADFGNLGL